jgi:hypothetical protein
MNITGEEAGGFGRVVEERSGEASPPRQSPSSTKPPTSRITSAPPSPKRIMLPSALVGGAGGGWVKWEDEIDEFALFDVVKRKMSDRKRLKNGGKKQASSKCYFVHHMSHVTRHASQYAPSQSSMPTAAATNLIVAKMKAAGCGFTAGNWVIMKNITA